MNRGGGTTPPIMHTTEMQTTIIVNNRTTLKTKCTAQRRLYLCCKLAKNSECDCGIENIGNVNFVAASYRNNHEV